MKKLVFFLAFMLIGLFAFANTNVKITNNVEITLNERNGKLSIVTEEEYNSASEFNKKMINQIDASIAALDVLKLNSDNLDLNAIVSISKDLNNKFSNAIIISKIEKNQEDVIVAGSCNVCGVRSAYSCLKMINADDSLGDTFDVTVTRLNNGCVKLTW
jgi:hypothetical protein